MKKYIFPSIKMTLVFLVLCSGLYPVFIAAIGKLTKGHGRGETLMVHGKVVGYAKIGQKFDQDKYFWSRPSAVGYNAAGSGGSNKGPTNPDYLKDVQSKIDSFLMHNPKVKTNEIPAELVTYSGSGLDPDLSPAGAYIQIARIAKTRNISEEKLMSLVDRHIENPLIGFFGPKKVNVLKLNIDLDQLN
jgi:K+-transporting ATPase ATPase C chain